MSSINVRVLTLICLGATTVFSAEEAPGNLELLGTNVISFGTYPNTEDRTAHVQIRNAGDEPLRVRRIVTTCKCMRVDAFPKTLGPGESGEVAVSIMKNEVAGAFERIFYIDAGAPTNRSVRVSLQGFAKPLFMVTCDTKTALGPVEVGQVWTGRYTVAATETGLTLGPPSVQSRGTSCTFSVLTNQQERMVYEVTHTVTFEGEGILESVLLFPIVREDGEKSLPVRLEVDAVRRKPLRVVPDRLLISSAQGGTKRRLLVSVTTDKALEAEQLRWEVPVEGIEVRTMPAKSGKALFVDLTFSAEAVTKLVAQGGARLILQYGGGPRIEVPVQPGL